MHNAVHFNHCSCGKVRLRLLFSLNKIIKIKNNDTLYKVTCIKEPDLTDKISFVSSLYINLLIIFVIYKGAKNYNVHFNGSNRHKWTMPILCNLD